MNNITSSKSILVLMLVIFIFFNKINAQQITRTMARIPDSGQSISYTTTFGEDNDYSIYTPSFSSITNGTTTDLQTTLMWQVKDGGEMTITDATIYCDTLTLGGYDDWRLPTPIEAFSILNHQNANPAINTSVFTTTAAEYWYTSARQANDTTKIWVTNAGGGIGNHPNSETISAGGSKKIHVRAVRNTNIRQSIPSRFTNQNDSVVYDALTGLYWTKYAANDSLTWEDALNYAENITASSHSDWRLPNIKELQSLNDEKLTNPSFSSTAFPTIGVNKYWSSTTLPNQTSQAWYLHTQYGITTYSIKTGKLKVLCVRDSANTKFTSINPKVQKQSINCVYPNPFKNYIYLLNQSNVECRLLNNIGEIIYTGTKIESQDFDELPIGLYFLQYVYSGQSIKLIKE